MVSVCVGEGKKRKRGQRRISSQRRHGVKVKDGRGRVGGATPRRTQEYHIHCLRGEGREEVYSQVMVH